MNPYNTKVTVELEFEVDPLDVPTSMLSGNMEDQIKDILKDACFNLLGVGSFQIKSMKIEKS